MLDALAKRHVYSTLDRNCKLTFLLNGTTMGNVIEEPVTKVNARAVVDDADIRATTAKTELYEDGHVVSCCKSGTNVPPALAPKPGAVLVGFTAISLPCYIHDLSLQATGS